MLWGGDGRRGTDTFIGLHGDYMGVSQNLRYLFRDPYNKDYSILGPILGSPDFGKPPY